MKISDNIFTFLKLILNYQIYRYGNHRFTKTLQWNDREKKIYLLFYPSIYFPKTEIKLSKPEYVILKSSDVMKISCLKKIFIPNFTPN